MLPPPDKLLEAVCRTNNLIAVLLIYMNPGKFPLVHYAG